MTTTSDIELEATELLEPEKEEKLPRKATLGFEKANKKETVFRGMRALVEVADSEYTIVKETITSNKEFRFLLSVINDKGINYIFAVFKRVVTIMPVHGEKYSKAKPNYWENIEYLWQRGQLKENIGFKGIDDSPTKKEEPIKNSTKLTTTKILEMTCKEAQEILSLEDYERFYRLKYYYN